MGNNLTSSSKLSSTPPILESYISSKAFNRDLIIEETSGSDEGRSATVPCIAFSLHGDFFNNNCCFDAILEADACVVDIDASDANMGPTVDVDVAADAVLGRVISDSIGVDNVCLDVTIDCCCRTPFGGSTVELTVVSNLSSSLLSLFFLDFFFSLPLSPFLDPFSNSDEGESSSR